MTTWTYKKVADYLEECREQGKVPHLEGAVLSGLDLRGLDFTGANLKGATLRESILDGSVFEFSDLSGATLSGTAAYGARFTRANLSGADFSASDVLNACFRGANLTRTDFDLTNLELANFDFIKIGVGILKIMMYHTLEGWVIYAGRVFAATLEDLLEAVKSGEKGRILPENLTLEKAVYLLAPYLEFCTKEFAEYLTVE